MIALLLLACSRPQVAPGPAPTAPSQDPHSAVRGALSTAAPGTWLWGGPSAPSSELTSYAVSPDGSLAVSTRDGVVQALAPDGQVRWSTSVHDSCQLGRPCAAVRLWASDQGVTVFTATNTRDGRVMWWGRAHGQSDWTDVADLSLSTISLGLVIPGRWTADRLPLRVGEHLTSGSVLPNVDGLDRWAISAKGELAWTDWSGAIHLPGQVVVQGPMPPSRAQELAWSPAGDRLVSVHGGGQWALWTQSGDRLGGGLLPGSRDLVPISQHRVLTWTSLGVHCVDARDAKILGTWSPGAITGLSWQLAPNGDVFVGLRGAGGGVLSLHVRELCEG